MNENPNFNLSRFGVVYKQGIINYPTVHKTKLYFFDSAENAHKFANAQFDDLVIWKVEAADLRDAPLMTGPSNATKYWNKILDGITCRVELGYLLFSDGTDMPLIRHVGAMTGSHCKLLEQA